MLIEGVTAYRLYQHTVQGGLNARKICSRDDDGRFYRFARRHADTCGFTSTTSLFWRRECGYKCAIAASAAEAKGSATEEDLATCATAINLAADMKNRLAAALTNRSVMHLARAEYAATIADSDAALQLDHKIPEAMVNRGVALMLEGRLTDAVKDFTRALELAPSHVERAYFNRAMAREDMGDLKGAYLDYRMAAQLDPLWDRPKKELARFTVVQRAPTS
jgi:tetratricopeptide (TPR) repeat protein